MAKLLSLKIDVTKIDKSRLFKGAKGTYLDLTVALNDELDQYGNDVSAWQGQTKEEVQAKEQKTYLGNGKVFWSNDAKADPVHEAKPITEGQVPDNQEGDLPF